MSEVGKKKVYIWTISSRFINQYKETVYLCPKTTSIDKKSKILVLLLDFKVLLFTEKDSSKFHTVSVVYLASVVNAVV